MNYDLLTTARAFLSTLHRADDAMIDAAFQRLATEANDSDFAAALEPRQGVCAAIIAEVQRRAFVRKQETDAD